LPRGAALQHATSLEPVTRTREWCPPPHGRFLLQKHQRPPSQMHRTLRLLLVTAAVAAASLGGTARAFACGSGGYSYAGLGAPSQGYGISALITPLGAF